MMNFNKEIDFTEFYKLVGMLSCANIPHTVKKIFNGFQVIACGDDAVIHFGSHGVEKGLLECYKLGDCVGFQTAEEVFRGWTSK